MTHYGLVAYIAFYSQANHSGDYMPTITLRLPENRYRLFRKLAEEENRSLANFIETATIRHIEEFEYEDSLEVEELRKNKKLNQCIARGHRDAKHAQGNFVE